MTRYTLMLILALGLVSYGCSDDSTDPVDTEDVGMDTGDTDAGNDATEDDAGEKYSEALNLPETPANYANPEIPEHYRVETLFFHGQVPAMDDDNTPADNPTTDLGATLGRVLFYDTSLSQNGTIACSSCHLAEFGFSDDRVLSEGFDGGLTGRHSMGLTNARFYGAGRFFWDQRAETLEEQVLMPFQDAVEMGMTLEEVVEAVEAADYYPVLFEDAFGDDVVTSDRIAKALAQFVRSMISTGSRYDKGRSAVVSRGAPFPNFTAEENRGKFLFVNPPPRGGVGCFICHQGEAFIAHEATSNGLDASFEQDEGFGGVTELAADYGTFKVPSLRNVDRRAPYMHDGRFFTLDEVIDHYSDNVQPSPNLGPPFFVQNGAVGQFNLSDEDKAALVAFLHTLTDEEMLADPKFSDPFVK